MAHGAFTVTVGFLLPNFSGVTVMPLRLVDGLIVAVGDALGDGEAEVDADGVASEGDADGFADCPQAVTVSRAAAQRATAAVLAEAKGTP